MTLFVDKTLISNFLIYEQKSNYVKHDQLFKELIHNFFNEFLEVFFPEVHKNIDFSSIKPLSEELYTNLLDGENRRIDIAVEVKLKGEDTLIIVHVKPQSTHQKGFNHRMYRYFSMLYNKYQKPILPIAIFSYDSKHIEHDQFTIEFPFFHVLTFNFLMIELKKMDWRDYIKSNNPVAAALLSKMGYTKEEKVQVKIEFLRMMVKMELDPARTRFITGFFEQYLTLDHEEEEKLMKEISQSENPEEFTELPISWEERGIRKGLEQGLERGIEQAKREIVLEMLKEGLTIEFIAKMTHLDQEVIKELKARH